MLLVVNNLAANAGDRRDMGLIRKGLMLGQEDPWRKAWQPTPVSLLGETHGQRRLVSP